MLRNKFRFIWASSFRGEDLKNKLTNQKNELPMAPCLLTDWEKISKLYKKLSIDAEYPVSIHLNKWFKKRRFTCEQLTDDGRHTTDVKWWQKLTLLCQCDLKKVFVTQHRDRQMYGLTEINCLQSMIPETNMTSSIYVYT